jgi:hypothetical protein
MNLRYVVEYVDQRQIQRYGGNFTKYPSSYIVCRLLRNYGLKRVLDVTYGEGRFYRLCFPELEISGADPMKWSWVVKPKQFYQLNVFQLHLMLRDGKILLGPVDVVVVDPPRWNTEAVYRKRDMFNFLIGTPKLIIEYASKVASLIRSQYLLVHYSDIVMLEGFEPVHIVEFIWLARYAYTENKNKSLYILYKSI